MTIRLHEAGSGPGIHKEVPMTMSEHDSSQRPWWVRVSLRGLSTRGSALACVWLSLAVAVGCGVAGFWDWRAWTGLVFLLGAWGYWRAIRWVDRHSSWK
jgi:hypothetical protein